MQYSSLNVISIRKGHFGDHQVWILTEDINYCKKCEFNGRVHQLFIDFEKAYDSVRREVLYNIFIEFVIPIN